MGAIIREAPQGLSDLEAEYVVRAIRKSDQALLLLTALKGGVGPTLAWRIELSAAIMAAMLEHATTAAEDNETDLTKTHEQAIGMVVRRAKEIYGVGYGVDMDLDDDDDGLEQV